jgi:hypothetical protein
MDTKNERRTEQRLRYHWPIWFAENFDGELAQGQMVDISSTGAAFTCYVDDRSPYLGQQITARFSVPHYASDGSFDMEDFIRSGQICRINDLNRFLRRVAIRFVNPLPFKPGEQADFRTDSQKTLKTAMI